jgi:hypothetical protein
MILTKNTVVDWAALLLFRGFFSHTMYAYIERSLVRAIQHYQRIYNTPVVSNFSFNHNDRNEELGSRVPLVDDEEDGNFDVPNFLSGRWLPGLLTYAVTLKNDEEEVVVVIVTNRGEGRTLTRRGRRSESMVS